MIFFLKETFFLSSVKKKSFENTPFTLFPSSHFQPVPTKTKITWIILNYYFFQDIKIIEKFESKPFLLVMIRLGLANVKFSPF